MKKLLILSFILVYSKVDVVIFSSNNIIALNLCLDSLNRFAQNVGLISIIYHVDNLADCKLYNKLINDQTNLFFKRAFYKDEIVRDMYITFAKGKNSFALCLTDDMILTRELDFNLIENILLGNSDAVLLTVGRNSDQANQIFEQNILDQSDDYLIFNNQDIKDYTFFNIFGAITNKQNLKSLFKLTRESNLIKFNKLYFQNNLKLACLNYPVAVKLQENKRTKFREAYSEIFLKKNFKIELAEILQNYANQNVLSTEFTYRAIS